MKPVPEGPQCTPFPKIWKWSDHNTTFGEQPRAVTCNSKCDSGGIDQRKADVGRTVRVFLFHLAFSAAA